VISYPGDVLARFGRYEAVEDRGTSGRAHLWRAWDPFVERFVMLAVLVDVSHADVIKGWRHFDAALREWTGACATSVDEVLDFAPPDSGPAFIVLRLDAGTGAPMHPDEPTPSAPSAPSTPSGQQGGWGRMLLGGLMFLLACALAWFVADRK